MAARFRTVGVTACLIAAASAAGDSQNVGLSVFFQNGQMANNLG